MWNSSFSWRSRWDQFTTKGADAVGRRPLRIAQSLHQQIQNEEKPLNSSVDALRKFFWVGADRSGRRTAKLTKTSRADRLPDSRFRAFAADHVTRSPRSQNTKCPAHPGLSNGKKIHGNLTENGTRKLNLNTGISTITQRIQWKSEICIISHWRLHQICPNRTTFHKKSEIVQTNNQATLVFE